MNSARRRCKLSNTHSVYGHFVTIDDYTRSFMSIKERKKVKKLKYLTPKQLLQHQINKSANTSSTSAPSSTEPTATDRIHLPRAPFDPPIMTFSLFPQTPRNQPEIISWLIDRKLSGNNFDNELIV